jgi:hypothetical protein
VQNQVMRHRLMRLCCSGRDLPCLGDPVRPSATGRPHLSYSPADHTWFYLLGSRQCTYRRDKSRLYTRHHHDTDAMNRVSTIAWYCFSAYMPNKRTSTDMTHCLVFSVGWFSVFLQTVSIWRLIDFRLCHGKKILKTSMCISGPPASLAIKPKTPWRLQDCTARIPFGWR